MVEERNAIIRDLVSHNLNVTQSEAMIKYNISEACFKKLTDDAIMMIKYRHKVEANTFAFADGLLREKDI